MENLNKECAIGFIENIWNENRFDILSNFIHPDFKDHSLPFDSLQNKTGLILYLKALKKAFSHKTIIEDLVCEGNMVMMRIKIMLSFRKMENSYTQEEKSVIRGYRYLKMVESKITDHWELIEMHEKEGLLAKVNAISH